MSPSKKSTPPRRSRGSHAAGRHGAATARATRRPDPRARSRVAAIVALDAIGWRVTELRPAIGHGHGLWLAKIERVDLVASMTVIAPDPDVALQELARYAAIDSEPG
jgi:hypothetical protein